MLLPIVMMWWNMQRDINPPWRKLERCPKLEAPPTLQVVVLVVTLWLFRTKHSTDGIFLARRQRAKDGVDAVQERILREIIVKESNWIDMRGCRMELVLRGSRKRHLLRDADRLQHSRVRGWTLRFRVFGVVEIAVARSHRRRRRLLGALQRV